MRYHCPLIETIENKMQGLSQIKLVSIDLQDRPAWYKEKVYPPNKVGSCVSIFLLVPHSREIASIIWGML
jgi:hypothetical protein